MWKISAIFYIEVLILTFYYIDFQKSLLLRITIEKRNVYLIQTWISKSFERYLCESNMSLCNGKSDKNTVPLNVIFEGGNPPRQLAPPPIVARMLSRNLEMLNLSLQICTLMIRDR